jgi:hypothetical protein
MHWCSTLPRTSRPTEIRVRSGTVEGTTYDRFFDHSTR